MKKLFFLLVIVCSVSCNKPQPAVRTGLEGKPMPIFSLLLADSVTYLNTEDISKGQPIVLFYFDPYCPYSRAQMSEIVENISMLKDVRFYVFTTASFIDMKGFYQQYQIRKYSNVSMGVDYNYFFGRYFNIKGVPFTAIYGADKILRSAFLGKLNGKQILSVVRNGS